MSATTVFGGIALNSDNQLVLDTTPGTQAGYASGGLPLNASDALRVFLAGSGILIVNNLTAGPSSLRLTDGAAKFVYVLETQSFYHFLSGSVLPDDGFAVVVPTVGVGGAWFHQGEDLYISPKGAPLLLDDWPTVVGATNACALYGKRVVLIDNGITGPIFQCKTSALPLASGARLKASADISIVCSLARVGLPTVAPFWSQLGTQGTITTITTAVKRGGFSVVTAVDKSATWVPGTILQIANAVTTGNSAGFRVSTHVVNAIAGVNINVLPDLPRDYGANSTITNFASRPTGIELDGGGATITGDAVRFFELPAALDCHVHDWFLTNQGAHDIAADLLGSFDGGSSACVVENMRILVQNATTPLAAWAFESADSQTTARNIVVDGGCSYGLIQYDCSDCVVDACHASHCPAAACFAFVSDTAVRDATTAGCIHCVVTNSTGLGSAQGALVTDGSRDCRLEHSSFDGNTNGILVNVAGGNTTAPYGNVIAACTARYNTSVGITIGTGALSSRIEGDTDVSGNGTSASTGTGCLLQGFTSISGLVASQGNNVNLILASLGGNFTNIRADASPTPAINGWCQLNGGTAVRYTMSDCELTLAGGAASSNTVQTAAVLAIQTTVLAANGGASTGVLTQVNGTLRIGRDNDWSACVTAYAANGGGTFSQGTVQLAAGAVNVPFTDLKATDRVRMTLKTLAGAALSSPPIIAYTPATGFSAQSVTAADTSTWEWSIAS